MTEDNQAHNTIRDKGVTNENLLVGNVVTSLSILQMLSRENQKAEPSFYSVRARTAYLSSSSLLVLLQEECQDHNREDVLSPYRNHQRTLQQHSKSKSNHDEQCLESTIQWRQ